MHRALVHLYTTALEDYISPAEHLLVSYLAGADCGELLITFLHTALVSPGGGEGRKGGEGGGIGGTKGGRHRGELLSWVFYGVVDSRGKAPRGHGTTCDVCSKGLRNLNALLGIGDGVFTDTLRGVFCDLSAGGREVVGISRQVMSL
jgi:hypothetical protein